MKTVILDAATLGEDIDLSVFSEFGEVVIYPVTAVSDVAERVKTADIAVINKLKLNESNLSESTLKLICIAATGSDNVDTAYCREKGIAVCNVAGYSTDSVAQVTVATVLSLFTHIPEYTHWVKSGNYSANGVANKLTPPYHELAGKTWGIVGYGNIGKKVADIARAFGCKVIVNKRTPDKNAVCVDIDALCEQADIISIHVPLTEKTRNMINAERIASMKDGVTLVNAARGAVCDEMAISDAVISGKIGFFGSDVYSTEPFGETHPFYKIKNCDNVCLTPHMAWGSVEARTRLINEMAENIRSFISGGRRSRID